jgi:hypothetical protein
MTATYWKIELTWHDHAKGEDRKYREVVQADSFDAARADAIRKCVNLGLFKQDTITTTEGQPFDDRELYDIREATKNFLKNRFKPFEKEVGQ